MRPVHIALITAVGLGLFSGCDNSCQQICDRMARYAEECDIPVDREDIKACKDAQAGAASRGDRAICREYNSGNVIREEWDCDDVRAYFNEPGSGAPDGGGDTDG